MQAKIHKNMDEEIEQLINIFQGAFSVSKILSRYLRLPPATFIKNVFH